MANTEEELLEEFPPRYGPDEVTSGEFYACPVGVALWEKYRAGHPNAPAEPPCRSEVLPDAVEYWAHSNDCDDCNEV
jgi:hypothetical protein